MSVNLTILSAKQIVDKFLDMDTIHLCFDGRENVQILHEEILIPGGHQLLTIRWFCVMYIWKLIQNLKYIRLSGDRYMIKDHMVKWSDEELLEITTEMYSYMDHHE